MSVDTTIGILVTCRRDGQPGQEFRVAHVRAIETISDEPDYPSTQNPVLNRERVRQCFAGSQMFTDREQALEAANRLLQKKGGYVEYGICELDYSNLHFPASNRTRRRRRHQRREQWIR